MPPPRAGGGGGAPAPTGTRAPPDIRNSRHPRAAVAAMLRRSCFNKGRLPHSLICLHIHSPNNHAYTCLLRLTPPPPHPATNLIVCHTHSTRRHLLTHAATLGHVSGGTTELNSTCVEVQNGRSTTPRSGLVRDAVQMQIRDYDLTWGGVLRFRQTPDLIWARPRLFVHFARDSLTRYFTGGGTPNSRKMYIWRIPCSDFFYLVWLPAVSLI
eukprot:gene2033-biopygen383